MTIVVNIQMPDKADYIGVVEGTLSGKRELKAGESMQAAVYEGNDLTIREVHKDEDNA